MGTNVRKVSFRPTGWPFVFVLPKPHLNYKNLLKIIRQYFPINNESVQTAETQQEFVWEILFCTILSSRSEVIKQSW